MDKNIDFIFQHIWVFDEDEMVCMELQGLICNYVKGSKGEVAGEMDNCFHEFEWTYLQN